MSRFSPPAVLGLRLSCDGRERQTSRRVDVGCFLGTDQDPRKGNPTPRTKNTQQLQRLHCGERFRFERSPHATADVRRRREVGPGNSSILHVGCATDMNVHLTVELRRSL